MEGYIHSIQTLGTVDGPGVRFVVFFQGCDLRCHCCHNPDTWKLNEGKLVTCESIINKLVRYKEYFKDNGGITISGGEPLLQPLFAYEIFKSSHRNNINTCLDTSGHILNDDVKKLLKETDRVLLDIKYTDSNLYNKYVGCDFNDVISFLDYLNKVNIKVTLRQVIIPTINDNIDNINKLKEIAKSYKCVDSIELLAFRKICQVKYDNLHIDFPFKDIVEASNEKIIELNSYLKDWNM